MPAPLVIDPQAIENLRALNPGDNDEFLREIAGIFLEDTPQRIAELNQSLAAGDVAKFTRAAHSIKGSSANLGATALRAAAEQLEHQSRTAGLTSVAALVSAISEEFARAELELKKIIAPK
jgi:HPt (histidine-containing phosphotransfer) domain-containing protein